MHTDKHRRMILISAIAAWITILYGVHQKVRRATIQKLRAGSQVAETERGPVEYAIEGDGPPILAIHGSSGGYEQGLLLTKLIDPGKHRVIGVSRPGFRQTPLSTGRTPEQQADACTALLDELKIQKAAVLGISAGGLPSIQMALRHPERCRALILISAVQPPAQGERVSPTVLAGLRSWISIPDFLGWALVTPFLSLPIMVDSSHIGGPIVVNDPETVAITKEMRFSFWPHSDGRDGILNDVKQITALQSYPLDQIRVPTLIIHGTHDAAVPVGLAEYAARTIPGAQSLFIEGGAHLILGTHYQQVGQRILQFLDEIS